MNDKAIAMQIMNDKAIPMQIMNDKAIPMQIMNDKAIPMQIMNANAIHGLRGGTKNKLTDKIDPTCTLCGALGTNRRTCPYNPRAKNPDSGRHRV